MADKTTQVLKLNVCGVHYSCILHHDDEFNPFWLYRHTWQLRECGYGMSERRRLVAKYADINSVLYHLAQNVR